MEGSVNGMKNQIDESKSNTFCAVRLCKCIQATTDEGIGAIANENRVKQN